MQQVFALYTSWSTIWHALVVYSNNHKLCNSLMHQRFEYQTQLNRTALYIWNKTSLEKNYCWNLHHKLWSILELLNTFEFVKFFPYISMILSMSKYKFFYCSNTGRQKKKPALVARIAHSIWLHWCSVHFCSPTDGVTCSQ